MKHEIHCNELHNVHVTFNPDLYYSFQIFMLWQFLLASINVNFRLRKDLYCIGSVAAQSMNSRFNCILQILC